MNRPIHVSRVVSLKIQCKKDLNVGNTRVTRKSQEEKERHRPFVAYM